MFTRKYFPIIMSLTIIVLLSSFFLFVYLEKQLAQKSISTFQLQLALYLDVEGTTQYRLSLVEKGSSDWIKLIKKLSVTEGKYSFTLAQFYQKQQNWTNSIHWYKNAISLNYKEAIKALSRLYEDQGNLIEARYILNHYGKQLAMFLVDEVVLAIAQGDIAFVKKYIPLLPSGKSATKLKAEIERYKIIQTSAYEPAVKLLKEQPTKQCDIKIQMFATSLDDLNAISILKKQFIEHPLNQFVCLSAPRYVSINELDCRHKKEDAITCNETIWKSVDIEPSSRFIGLLYPKGKANVHLGILYFDREDTLDVLAHEISHLLGFVDEYTLTESHPFCSPSEKMISKGASSRNVVLFNESYVGDRSVIRKTLLNLIPWADKINITTPILHKIDARSLTDEQWQVGTPKGYNNHVGLFQSRTCDKASVVSFKPILQRTPLEYYEIEFPRLYADFLGENITANLMPSYHYNIAIGLLRDGDGLLGKSWLLKAAEKEKINARKLKVLQLEF